MEQPLQPKWNKATRLAFRFFFVYFILYIAPFPLSFIPYAGYLFMPFIKLSTEAIDALGPFILGSYYKGSQINAASGDSSFSYARVVFFAGLSVIIMIAWSLVDRRQSHEKLFKVFHIALRYYLAGMMFSYGFAKVFPTQFPPPSAGWLNQTFGESSPMRLLWTFMGYSSTYTIFSGVGEVMGGLLLLFRRTKLLGAMVVAGVMIQVVMLNLSYDVPVKLFSIHLFLIAILIMAPDLSRLINLFLLNKPVASVPIENYFQDRRLNISCVVIKVLVILIIIVPRLVGSLEQFKKLKEHSAKATKTQSLFGEYEVETFVLNNDTIPPHEDDTRRWRGVMISTRSVLVKSMDGFTISWSSLINNADKKVTMLSKDGFTHGDFTYDVDSTTLRLTGILNENKMIVTARRKSYNSFLLLDRGFRWISEEPFNQ